MAEKKKGLTNQERLAKKDHAKLLYCKEQLTQKEIAQRVGATEATISRWVNDEKWDQLTKAITVTVEERLRSAIDQLSELDALIASRDENHRFPSKEESMIKNRLTNDIAALKQETNLTDVINVSMKVTEYFRLNNPEAAKSIVELFDIYIKDHLR